MLNELRKRALYLQKEDEEKYKIIYKLLTNDNIFLEIDINTAFNILKDLKIDNKDIEKIYISLTNPKEFN